MRSLETKQIILIPAFYSTLAAEKVTVESRGIQALFKEQALNADLTIDGVHLKAKGLDIYRKVLLNVLNSLLTTRSFSEIICV
jgi:hypothetical protein